MRQHSTGIPYCYLRVSAEMHVSMHHQLHDGTALNRESSVACRKLPRSASSAPNMTVHTGAVRARGRATSRRVEEHGFAGSAARHCAVQMQYSALQRCVPGSMCNGVPGPCKTIAGAADLPFDDLLRWGLLHSLRCGCTHCRVGDELLNSALHCSAPHRRLAGGTDWLRLVGSLVVVPRGRHGPAGAGGG